MGRVGTAEKKKRKKIKKQMMRPRIRLDYNWAGQIRLSFLILALGVGVTSASRAEEILFQDDFSGDLSRWVVEQTPSGKTRVIDGELDIDDAPGEHDKGGCTVWFQEKISHSGQGRRPPVGKPD